MNSAGHARMAFQARIVRVTTAAPTPFMAQLSANVPISCRAIAKFNIAVPSYALEGNRGAKPKWLKIWRLT
jgi:hypothetical protein